MPHATSLEILHPGSWSADADDLESRSAKRAELVKEQEAQTEVGCGDMSQTHLEEDSTLGLWVVLRARHVRQRSAKPCPHHR